MADYILIVEDDPDVRGALCEALEEEIDVVCVEHGEAALRYLGSHPVPCVILLDLMMPVMDGWTFRAAVLRDPKLAKIPVIVMTAAGAERAATVEATYVVPKPLDLGKVVNIVERYCHTRLR
jgi:CheY-like chemotaxis protein